jgi:subtilase family serine protease
MPRSSAALLPLSNLSTLSLCIVIFSALSFAAAPDRITGAVVSGQFVRLPAGVPRNAQAQFDQGPVDPSLRLSSMTLLTVPSASQQNAISRLLAQQQDPKSPLYHKWITPEQYGDRFGLSSGDMKKITNWLQSQGFGIGRVARGRNWITFSGTAAQAENAFQTKLRNFNVNGETHFSNTSPLAIPAPLSGVVVGVRGLNNFHPKSHAVQLNPDRVRPDYTTSSGNLFLAPGDIATMYDSAPLYAGGFDGTGQTLAVIGQTDVYLADLNDFRSGFGLSTISGCTTNSSNVILTCNAANFRYVLVNADPGAPTAGNLSEANIDIEWSGAVARNAQIIYVNAPDPNGGGVFESLYYAIDQLNPVPPVMTLSYGLCEHDELGFFDSDEAELKKGNLEGVTVLNSSGDSGAAECDYTSTPSVNGYSVSYPASSPEVTGVGGTLIPFSEYTAQYWNSGNGANGGSAVTYIPEEGWNDAQEIGEFCVANPTNFNCVQAGITSWATAQSSVGILAGGAGVSNCHIANVSGVCQSGFPQPTYQLGLTGLSLSGQAAARFSPDVSLLGSVYWPGFIVCTARSEIGGSGSTSSCASGIPTAVVCTGGNTLCSVFGGTSVGSPIFAGIVTLLNQYLAGSGTPGLGNINPKLYSLAATPANGVFHSAVASNPSLTFGSSGAFCSPGTPANQPVALQCPSSGFLGFDAANFDPTTGYNLVTGLGSVDANALAVAWAASRTATATSVSPSTSSTFESASVTLTATVTPSAATGTVTFFNGTSSLGTATVSGGVATLATTTLPIGTDNITASYDGNGTYDVSTSSMAPVVVVVAYTLSGPDISVTPGQQGTSTITIVPAAGFSSAITFTCSDPASESTCSLNPTSITPPGQTTTTLTIKTTAPQAQLHMPFDRGSQIFYAVLFPGLFGIVLTLGSRKRAARGVRLLSFIVVLGLSTIWLVACGGGGGGVKDPGTPKGTYTITVNAASGTTIRHSASLTLSVN